MAGPSEVLVPRRATARLEEGRTQPAPLSKWREAGAYVLLAAPGAGKTKAFEAEACATEGGLYFTARRFLAAQTQDLNERQVFFIDGLDEMRAGTSARDTALDAISRRLQEIGHPRFRLACREADWIGGVDTDALRVVAPDSEVTELRLEPLDEGDIRQVLRGWPERVPDVDAFWAQAESQQVTDLLANPLSLRLIVAATRDGLLPVARAQTYQLACQRLVSEENPSHRATQRASLRPTDDLLDEAGLLFAVLLLSGAEALSHDSVATALPSDIALETLQAEPWLKPSGVVLGSQLFIADGERRLPLHRTVAEFLAAAAVAERIEAGLPLGRILALTSGGDGGIVEPLRGMHAWMAVHCVQDRALLIERDPLGVVLYGDVSAFTSDEKQRVLDALGREARRYPWFRSGNWAAHPFGALGTTDMTPAFKALLGQTDRTLAHQSLLDCVLDAIRYGGDLRDLLPALEQVLRDVTFQDDVRTAALQAWLAQSRANVQPARAWLDDILNGTIADPRDELCGRLLNALYPDQLSPAEVMKYFRLPKAGNFGGFWGTHLIRKTPVELRPVLADGCAQVSMDRSNMNADGHLPNFLGKVISAALEASAEDEDPRRILTWLRTGMDKYGFAAIKGSDAEGVRNWLGAHPDVQKAVMTIAFKEVAPEPETQQRHFWGCDQLLYGARRPTDWYRWHLGQAAAADSEALARYCFDSAAYAALYPSADFEITMEDLEQWTQAQAVHWPQAGEWLQQAWSLPLEHWQADQHRREKEYQAEYLARKQQRRSDLAPYAEAIRTGTAPAGVMHHLALAYRGRFSDIDGDTPEARLQEYTDGGATDVADALAGFEAALTRSDLPSVSEILTTGLAQQEHLIRPACLVGAELASARDPDAPAHWSDELASRLVAFWLTDGTGETPAWYEQLARGRPEVVAPVMIAFAKRSIRERPDSSVPGLWSLAKDDDLRELAQQVLPTLLQTFPTRANEAQLRRLNQELLPAAVRHLERGGLSRIAEARLALKSLDAGQRIAWLAAALQLDPESRSRELMGFVGHSQTRAVQLGVALASQGEHRESLRALPAQVLAALVETLAPHASPSRPEGAFWVDDTDHRRDLVSGFIRRLAALPEEAANEELTRLRALPSLKAWALPIDAARADQTRVRRSNGFRHASAQAVVATLANRAPANASDLCALAVDHLHDFAKHLVGDDTNSVQMFWRADQEGRQVPEIENTCRDRLMGKLRDKLLPLSVQLEKEASAANDTRADLRVSAVAEGRRVVVPIEIKKDDHKAIWSAWRSQLDGSYVTDPAAEGFGIYLVLWFGHKPRSAPDGARPRSSLDLEQSLQSRIPAEDRARLVVVVLDLSRRTKP